MKRQKREHKDSIHIPGAKKVTFSRGKNGFGAMIDGKKQILKKKVREFKRPGGL